MNPPIELSNAAGLRRRSVRGVNLRALIALGCSLFLFSPSLPSSAGIEDDIKELERQKAELEEQQREQASDVEVATAETQELTQALKYWNREVNEIESDLDTAQAALEEAEGRLDKAEAEVILAEAKADDLENKVASRAVNAFVGRDTGAVSSANEREPKEATRARTMVGEATDRDFDVAEELRATREDLAVKRAQADAAREQADAQKAVIEAELVEVAKARDKQAELLVAAEDRLDRELYEQAAMAEQGLQIDNDIKAKRDELAEQIAAQRAAAERAAAAKRSSSSSGSISYPSGSEIVKVRGFRVHVDIAQNLEDLLAAAEADGITLGGWGYRDHQTQIRLRKSHCGSSDWAIWHKPSSQCRPPTARPGRSMHEQGKAIDFTYNGGSMSSRSNAGYKWLAANASKYGLYNLPSEPWHWSTNGN